MLYYKDNTHKTYPRIIQPRFEDIFTYENLEIAAYECAKGVSWKRSVQNYLLQLPSNTSTLYDMVMSETFVSPGFCHFTIDERGKIRDINSVRIEERIIQKVLCILGLRPCIVPRLLDTNCASLPGRGTDSALFYFKQNLANACRKYGPNCNILITDYHGYYDSIDHPILLNNFYNCIEDKKIFNLLAYFVSRFIDLNQGSRTISTMNSIDPSLSPSSGCERKKGIYEPEYLDMFDWYDDNSYFNKDTRLDVGLGLGSEVSQISAIFYVNPIDHSIKEKYKIEHYTRYMDDSYLIDPDIVKLKECFEFMKEESLKYGLIYNPKHTNIYKISDYYTFLKKRTHVDPKTGKVVMKLLHESIVKHRRTFKNQRHLLDAGRMTMEDIYNCFYSWLGSVTWLNSRTSLKELVEDFIHVYQDQLDEPHKLKLRKW